jgi:hypothetical protein
MRSPRINLRAVAGMMLSRECRLYYWTGWVAWVIGGWALVYAEYTFRVSLPPAFYMVEAWLAMLMPFLAMVVADWLAIRIYQAVWFEFNRRALGAVALESMAVDRIREELRKNVLLRFLRPPASRSIGDQLLTAALWYRALTMPEDSPWWQRYGEWAVDVLLGYIPLLIAVVLLIGWLSGLTGERYGLALAAIPGGLSMLVLGYSALRFASRRQAIIDYFQAWRQQREEAGQP